MNITTFAGKRLLSTAEPSASKRVKGSVHENLPHQLREACINDTLSQLFQNYRPAELEEAFSSEETEDRLATINFVMTAKGLRAAQRVNAVRQLLENGAKPNQPQKRSLFTPLHAAILQGNQELYELLIEYNADPMWLSRSGDTPFGLPFAQLTEFNEKQSHFFKKYLSLEGFPYENLIKPGLLQQYAVKHASTLVERALLMNSFDGINSCLGNLTAGDWMKAMGKFIAKYPGTARGRLFDEILFYGLSRFPQEDLLRFRGHQLFAWRKQKGMMEGFLDEFVGGPYYAGKKTAQLLFPPRD